MEASNGRAVTTPRDVAERLMAIHGHPDTAIEVVNCVASGRREGRLLRRQSRALDVLAELGTLRAEYFGDDTNVERYDR